MVFSSEASRRTKHEHDQCGHRSGEKSLCSQSLLLLLLLLYCSDDTDSADSSRGDNGTAGREAASKRYVYSTVHVSLPFTFLSAIAIPDHGFPVRIEIDMVPDPPILISFDSTFP